MSKPDGKMPELDTSAKRETIAVPDSIFRAYDIRGIAENGSANELNCDNIRLIGKAIGSQAIESGEETLLFACDGRLSSPPLAAALIEGILSTGCNIVNLGVVPTPLLYFATHNLQWTSGLMLTASHNPADYNGIKLIHRRSCLSEAQIQLIRQRVVAGGFLTGEGEVSEIDIKPAYLDKVREALSLIPTVPGGKRPKIVLDCGNAVPAVVAPALFEALGCEVIPLYCELDGRFPNHHPDPTIAENLVELVARVKSSRADFGIAFDGDGDRVVVVTGQGKVIDTDRLLMLFVKDILPRYRNARQPPRVIFDVKCSQLVPEIINACGGAPVMSRSGHSFMKQAMLKHGAVVGAEFSAHVFISDNWYGYDDGLYVAARFLELVRRRGLTADELLQELPARICTPELRIDVSDTRKFKLMEVITKLANGSVALSEASISNLDGVRADFEDGWGLVRASNTTPALLLRFEARNEESLTRIRGLFTDLLEQAGLCP